MSYEVLPKPYKVWVLNNNAIENVFVFGKKDLAFSEEDRDMMMEFGISIDSEIIIESPVQIHDDDSIMQLKKKILNEFGRESGASYHEMHLFAYTEKFIDPYAIFYDTVAKNTNYINRAKCTQLLHNLLDEFEPLDETKDIYTYDDFVSAMGHPRKHNVPIGLGMLPTKDWLFSPNPFHTTEFSPREAVHTDNVLLFSHGKIVDNNIFVCLAGDIFAAHMEKSEFMAKTYYPLLTSKSVFDINALLDKRPQLVAETDKMMDARHFKTYQIVDMFYDIHQNSSEEHLEYTENGVRKIEIAIKPSYSFVMPLETIFKNLHATPKYKYMKLNLGIRRENIYRLYSNKISKTGRKIPTLKPEKINSLSKKTGKQKQLSIYADDRDLYIDIENDGVITVSWDSKKKSSMKVREIEEMLIQEVNPLIENLNQCLQNSGYIIPMIQSIEDPNIEIKSMDYVASIVLKKKTKAKEIKLKRDIGCLYAMFDIVSDLDKNGKAEMRFKRVNNYREMDQQSLLITETYNKKGRESDVLEALMLNHNMSINEAGARIALYLKDAEYNAIDGNTIEVVDNPGFPIKISIKGGEGLVSKSELEFVVENISHLGYIKSLSVYFESMMRLLQNIKIPGAMKEMCKQVKKEDAVAEETLAKPIVRERAAAFDFSPTSPMSPRAEETLAEREDAEKSPMPQTAAATISYEDLMNAKEEAKEDYILKSDSSDLDLTGVQQEDDDDDDLDLTGIEQEEEEEDTIKGGAPSRSSSSDDSADDLYIVKNKERAKNTNPFLMELQRKDPDVILQGKDGRSNIYSRSCQSYRQPVVLTAEEKARIDRKSPGSYTKAMKYGSTPDKEHYYICPRYWCFKTNTSVNDPSECDKDYLFEFKNQANPIEHEDANGNYIPHYPGFIKKQGLKHCMPCCFGSAWETWKKDPTKNKWNNQNKTTKWDAEGNKLTRTGKGKWTKQDVDGEERVDETGAIWKMDKTTGEWKINENEKELPRNAEKCKSDMNDMKSGSDESNESSPVSPTIGKTIVLNPDTKQVPTRKIAFLQYSVQHFMNIEYTGKYTTINNANQLNEGVKVLVRYGVGEGKVTLLTDCIADLLGVASGQIGQVLADAVELDKFVKFGNSSLVATFRPKAIEIGDESVITDENGEIWTKDETGKWKEATLKSDFPTKIASIKIVPDEYSHTDFYKYMKSLSEKKENIDELMWETIASYEIYKLYLMNPENKLDYTYVWDLIATPNTKLFKEGLNMVIMELPQKDITDSIDLICPTNTYSKSKFDIAKPTVFLIKSLPRQDEMVQFEPIYFFDESTKKITRTFDPKIKGSHPGMKSLFKMLNRTLNNYCRPKQSMPDIYEYKQPILLHDLTNVLQELSYTIVCQVLNYQGKVVALQVQNPVNPVKMVYVPCHPSAPLDTVDKKMIDDEDLWKDYDTTRQELEILHKASGGKIPCNPMLKMISDKAMIVGLLTWTNQMVPINPPVEDVPGDGLRSMSVDNNEIATDVSLTKGIDGDSKRLEIIRNAKIESKMYSLFRSTVKTLLAKHENHGYRDYLINETRNVQRRKDSITNIIKKLVKLTRNTIVFEDFDEATRETIGKMDEISYTCNNSKKQTRSALLKDGCKLIVPRNNLLVPTRDNRLLYYYRVADELLRFKQHSNFILNSKQILNTGTAEYKVNNNEFIVLESSLTSNYYENQPEMVINQYMSGEIPYEMATAEKKITEPNTVSLETQGVNDGTSTVSLLHNCIDGDYTDLVGDANVIFWIKDVFKVKKGNKYEMRFKPTVECSFGPILKILGDFGAQDIQSIDDVRELLWISYRDLITPENDAIKEQNLAKIVDLMRNRQGKSAAFASVDSVAKFEAVIMNANYFMTTLDLYVLAQKTGLPIILFTNNNKENTVQSLDDLGFQNGNWLIMGKQTEKSADNKFYFVRAQKKIKVQTPASIPAHSMVYRSFAFAELNALKERIQSAFQGGDWSNHMMSIEDFLHT